jgi:adenylate kinase
MDLVFFGIQGSGKGTQAKMLAEEFGYYIFEAGGELRKIKASGSELGETVKKYIDNGELVPFEIIMEVVNEAVAGVPADQQILFDGIPRDEEQKRGFDRTMTDAGREFRCVHILLDKNDAIERIKGRAETEGRADDADQEKVLRRMDLFVEKTMPAIESYASAGKVIEIDGKGSVEEIYERIKEGISGL